AFLRVEPGYDLEYHVVDREPLIVLMPSDHRLTAREAVRPQDFVGEIFIGGSNKAAVLRTVTEDYLRRTSSWITGWTIWRWPCRWSRPPAGWR
ncbi:MAG TPA: LysR substrate-binding domain-containing protein, partial [Methylocella sp.]|nr:LysR substrate-binding domain-containing protein [Methylocella sp.]